MTLRLGSSLLSQFNLDYTYEYRNNETFYLIGRCSILNGEVINKFGWVNKQVSLWGSMNSNLKSLYFTL